jgi:hypothetical protein
MKGGDGPRMWKRKCITSAKLLRLECGECSIEAVEDFDLRYCPCTVAAVARASHFRDAWRRR